MLVNRRLQKNILDNIILFLLIDFPQKLKLRKNHGKPFFFLSYKGFALLIEKSKEQLLLSR